MPLAVRGGTFSGYIAVADWYGTLSSLVGVAPDDPVPGLPPVDSVAGLWEALLVPNNTRSPRTELLLSYSCTAKSNASGCDPEATSIYNTSGDPTGNQACALSFSPSPSPSLSLSDSERRVGGSDQANGDMALISGNHKIIFGEQQGRGIWFGPVYPNGTHDHPGLSLSGALGGGGGGAAGGGAAGGGGGGGGGGPRGAGGGRAAVGVFP